MKRKLVKQGSSTLMVSLPAKWAKDNHLDKGDEVEIGMKGNDLIIRRPDTNKEQKAEATIRITTNVETSIRTMISNVYRLGYGKVTAEFENDEQFQILSEVIKTRLLGFEIITKEKNKCIIENITEPSAEHTENIFLKVFYNISQIIDSTRKMLDGEDLLSEIKELEGRIYQYDNFVRRIESIKRESDTTIRWAFHTELIHAQRDIFFIAKFISENKNMKVSGETKEYFDSLKEIFADLKEGYFKKDVKRLEQIHYIEKDLIYNKGYGLLSKYKGKEGVIIYRITSAIRSFYLASSPLTGLFVNNG